MHADFAQVAGVIFFLVLIVCAIAVAGFGAWCMVMACVDAPRGIRASAFLVGVVIATVGVLFTIIGMLAVTNLHHI